MKVIQGRYSLNSLGSILFAATERFFDGFPYFAWFKRQQTFKVTTRIHTHLLECFLYLYAGPPSPRAGSSYTFRRFVAKSQNFYMKCILQFEPFQFLLFNTNLRDQVYSLVQQRASCRYRDYIQDFQARNCVLTHVVPQTDSLHLFVIIQRLQFY